MRRSSLAVLLGTVALIGLAAYAIEAVARRIAPLPPMRSQNTPETLREYIDFVVRANAPRYRLTSIDGRRWFVAADGNVRPQRVSALSAPGVRRLVVVGESSADLLGVAANRRFGNEEDRLEIINLGVGGASLEITRNKLSEALAFKPDAVLLLFGNNFMFDTPTSVLSYRLSMLARRSSAVLLAKRILPGDHDVHQGDRLEALESFLYTAADILRRRNISLIVCTVPSNHLFPPAPLDDERRDPAYRAALGLRILGRRGEARRALEDLDLRRPTAWRSFLLGEWALADGDSAEANRRFIRARDMDPDMHRAPSAANLIVRKVAVEKSLELLDLEALIDAQAPHGIPGWESFEDDCHPSERLFDAEARALGATLERLWPGISILPGSNAGPGPARNYLHYVASRITAPDDYWAESLPGFFQHEFARRSNPAGLIDYRFESGSDGAAWRRALAPLAAGEAAWRSGDGQRALALNARAVQAAPQWGEPPFRRGVYQLSLGRRTEALKSFAKAAALAPSQTDAETVLTLLNGR
jgi:hypothetical protein